VNLARPSMFEDLARHSHVVATPLVHVLYKVRRVMEMVGV
jgi:hypothetical protein